MSDLVLGHICALKWLENNKHKCEIFNLGMGKGCSVLELISELEKVMGKKIDYKIVARRAGDLDIVYTENLKIDKSDHLYRLLQQ